MTTAARKELGRCLRPAWQMTMGDSTPAWNIWRCPGDGTYCPDRPACPYFLSCRGPLYAPARRDAVEPVADAGPNEDAIPWAGRPLDPQ